MSDNKAEAIRHATSKGEHVFLLTRRADGVFMRRKAAVQDGAAVEHSILFSCERAFLAWCEDDPVLREHPLLDREVRRSMRELLGND